MKSVRLIMDTLQTKLSKAIEEKEIYLN